MDVDGTSMKQGFKLVDMMRDLYVERNGLDTRVFDLDVS